MNSPRRRRAFRTAGIGRRSWVRSLPSIDLQIETLVELASVALDTGDTEGARHKLTLVGQLASSHWMPPVNAIYDAVHREARVAAVPQPGFEHPATQQLPTPLLDDARRLRSATASIVGFAQLGCLEGSTRTELSNSIEAITSNLRRLRGAEAHEPVEAWEAQLARYLEQRASTAYATLTETTKLLSGQHARAADSRKRGNLEAARFHLQELSKHVQNHIVPTVRAVLAITGEAAKLRNQAVFEQLIGETSNEIRGLAHLAHDANNALYGVGGQAELAALPGALEDWAAQRQSRTGGVVDDSTNGQHPIERISRPLKTMENLLSGKDGGSVSLYHLVHDLTTDLAFEGKRGRPTITQDFGQADKADLWVAGGRVTWEALTTNLLVNSWKHGKASTVSFGYEKLTDGRVKVTVSDDGGGIRPELRESLWTGEGATDNGLGLPRVKAMLREIGGTIRLVDSRRGTKFEIIVLPLSADTPADS